MRCNNDQCQHHDGYERCAKPDQVIISSIGQCVLQFEPARKPLEIGRPKAKPTPEAVMNWLLSCGGEASIRTMARKFRGFLSRTDEAFQFASEMMKNGQPVKIIVTKSNNGRPSTLIRVDSQPEQEEDKQVEPTAVVTVSTPGGPCESLRKRFEANDESPTGGVWVPTWELVEYIKQIGGECNASKLRARFHRFKASGSANQALDRLVNDGFGSWASYSGKSGNIFRKFVLRGYEGPQEPPSDDRSPIKENTDRSHPLAQPTQLRPGSKARIELMRERVEQGLPAVINGDRFGYDDETFSG